jgi:hypothetical protein
MPSWNSLYDPAEILNRHYGPATSFKYPHTIPSLYRKRSWGILDFIFGFRGGIDPVETDFGDFRIDFLGEYHAKCETALGCESGP